MFSPNSIKVHPREGAMWFPLGKPSAGAMFYELRGAYGANKTCKERDHPGSQGWRSGTCASLGEIPSTRGLCVPLPSAGVPIPQPPTSGPP